MKKLEKILAIGGFVAAVSLVGYGCYMDYKAPEKDHVNSAIKGAGLAFFSLGTGLTIKNLIDYEDKRYFEGKKKKGYSI